ncbi:phosphatase PAP2 family protein [Halobellus clavatus]|uniref:PAP2 superfamily protein n=1 Tax=Halobellus clavatus TaxID=660517 RepID=A0A1H3EKZ5_9EURY|nr:phosphatase PAP2 family protein [Halobellus clavatus]SDX79270.1 PAP2 superfamily protein [Halobellus clavatus]
MTSPVTPLATRGVGEVAFAESLPDVVAGLFWWLTHLGNPYLLLALVALAYLFGDRVGLPRRSAAFALGLGLCAIGLTIGLKHAFALPRPPVSYRGGYGFPSGHALGSTAFWGGVGVLATRGRWRRRLTVAGVVVAVVALSRVLIGVHYLVDVVAGVGIGVAFLAAVFAAGPGFSIGDQIGALATPEHQHVTALFVLALGLGLLGLFVAPSESELLLGVGTALGAVLSWHRFGSRATAATIDISPRPLALSGGGLVVALAVMSGVTELTENARIVVAASAIGATVLLALPVLVGDEA